MVPKTNIGKIFCLIFMVIGIPYFAFMTAELSEKIDSCLRRNAHHSARTLYVTLGTFFLVIVPVGIFIFIEGNNN